MVTKEERATIEAECLRTLGVRRGPKTRELGANEAVRTGPSGDEERGHEHERRGALPGENEHREYRDDRRRHGRGNVGTGVQEKPQRPDPAGRDGEREAHEQTGDARQRHDQQRRPRAHEHQTEEIAADRVRAEYERPAGWERPFRAGRPVDHQEDGLVGRDPVAVRRDEDKEPAEGQAGEKPWVEAPHLLTVPAVRAGRFTRMISPTEGSPIPANSRGVLTV